MALPFTCQNGVLAMLFRYRKGDQIVLANESGIGIVFGVITGCYFERGKNVYDFMDNWGAPRWCYEDQIALSRRQI